MERVDQILRYVVGPKVLDVGCTDHVVDRDSNEWLYGKLVEKHPDLTAIDISEENLNTLRLMGYKNLYQQSAEDFTFDEKFDTIVAGELIEHLSNPGLFLSRAFQHLKPEGRLIITTPNPFCIFFEMYAFYKYPKTCPNDEHTCWFCPSTFRTLYRRYGFKEFHFDFLNDYQLRSESSLYQLFLILIRILRYVLPKRLRDNRLIFVLTKESAIMQSQDC